MSVTMGISLSSLSMDMLTPKRGWEAPTPRPMMSEEEQKRLQEELLLARVNADKAQNAESDSFFLQFTRLRGTAAAQSPTKTARIISAANDEHIIETKG